MRWKFHQTSQLKYDGTTEAIKGFHNISYEPSQGNPTVMTFLNGEKYGVPHLAGMATNT
jgi:hypothetical protein